MGTQHATSSGSERCAALTVGSCTMPLHKAWEVAACFFFFQAEDGIRDRNVTGVQTCALPISGKDWKHGKPTYVSALGIARARELAEERSEERRVGKECRSRWSPDH